MIDINHEFKVIDKYGHIFVTYDSYVKALTFMDNLFKERGVRLKMVKQKDQL